MTLFDYRELITPAMEAATRSGEYGRALKRLLTATEVMANLRSILLSKPEEEVLTEDEFVTSTFLLQQAVNNLQKLPKSFTEQEPVSGLRTVLYTEDKSDGTVGLNYNFERNTTAHILNLEHFVSQHKDTGLRKQWIEEFFAEGKILHQMLNTLHASGIITDTDISEFTFAIEAAGAKDERDVAVMDEAAGASAAAGGGVIELKSYATSLPQLIDASAGRGHRATEAAFKGHETALLQLLNYHVQLTVEAQSSANTSLTALAKFSQSMQVVGNISKILHVIGGIPTEIYDQLDFLTFIRNDLAHAKSIDAVGSYNVRDVEEVLVGTQAALETLESAKLVVSTAEQEVVEVKLQEALMLADMFAAGSGVSTAATASGAQGGAGGGAGGSSRRGKKGKKAKTEKHQTTDTKSAVKTEAAIAAEKEAVDKAIAEIQAKRLVAMMHDSESSDSDEEGGAAGGAALARAGATSISLREKFAASQAKKQAISQKVFEQAQTLMQLHQKIEALKESKNIMEAVTLTRTLPAAKSVLEDLLADPNFDINTTISVSHAEVKSPRRAKKKLQEERDLETLAKIVSGEIALVDDGAKTTEILPLNALLLLTQKTAKITGDISSSPYYAFAKAIMQDNSLSMNYVKELNAFTNPGVVDSEMLYIQNVEHNVEFSKTICTHYRDALTSSVSNAKVFYGKRCSVMLIAVIAGDLELLKILSLEAIPEKEMLFVATLLGHLDIVEYLAENGGDINAVTDTGYTALHVAAENGHLEVMKYLAENGGDIKVALPSGFTVLHLAAQHGYLKVVKHVADNGGDINAALSNGATALHIAVQNGHLDILQYLAGRVDNIYSPLNDGTTVLHLAAKHGHLEIVKYLAENGGDMNAAGADGFTALHLAVDKGHLDTVKWLVKEGHSNLEATLPSGHSALHIAAHKGYLKIVKYLAENGGDINAAFPSGHTSLHLAVGQGHLEIVKYLAKKVDDVDEALSSGHKALTIARQQGQDKIADWLVEYLHNVPIIFESGYYDDVGAAGSEEPRFVAGIEDSVELVGGMDPVIDEV